MVRWDIDRYTELQDAAWEFDSLATEQNRRAKLTGRRSEGDVNRRRAGAARQQAADLLATYWAPAGHRS
jgi:hypothetical protein